MIGSLNVKSGVLFVLMFHYSVNCPSSFFFPMCVFNIFLETIGNNYESCQNIQIELNQMN